MTRTSDPKDVVREAMRRATDAPPAELDRLLERTPELLREARRRRAAAVGEADLWSTLVPLIGRALPALAVASALLVAAVGWRWSKDACDPRNGSPAVATWLLGSETPATQDAVFEALIASQDAAKESTE